MADKTQETVEQKDQEIVISNDVTKKILDKYDEVSITQEEFGKREQNSEEDSAVIEEQQVTETEEVDVDITDDDLKVLSDAGITEDKLDGKTLAEIKQMVVDNTKQVKTKVETQESIIISDALADSLSAQYPFAKNLKGKTLNEVMEIIQNQNSYITSLEQQKKVDTNVTDRNTNSQTNLQTGDQTQELTQEEVIDLLSLKPDEATKLINEMIKKNGEQIAGKVFDEKIKQYMPDLNKVNQMTIENEKKMFFEQLGNSLPKGTDPKTAFDGWMSANKTKLSTEEKQALTQNPNLLIRLIAKEHTLNVTSAEKNDLQTNQDKTIKTQTYEKLRALLKQNRGSGQVFNFARKNSSSQDLSRDENEPENPVIDKILQKYEDQG